MATCYRHPNRETGVSCSNCARPICTDCMTPTPVGMRCPECARQKTKVANPVRNARPGALAARDLPVTKALIVVNVLVFLAQITTARGGFSGTSGTVFEHGALFGPSISIDHEYWRLVTSGFLHANLIHIGFNMYLLWVLGRMLEGALGSVRFAAIYFVAMLAGSLGVLVLEPNTVALGASGAVFGLMGAAFVELRRRGIDPFQAGIGGLIVFNLAFSFIFPGIAIGAHIGGLIGGGVAMLVLHQADRMRRSSLGLVGLAVLGAACAAASIAVV